MLPPKSALRMNAAMGSSSYPRSAVLVLGQSSIYSLLPSSLFAQVESLLQNGRLVEAAELLERASPADTAHGSTSSDDQRETLCFMHQCVAFAFMRQTRFREATAHFIKGTIDPRIPVSYFDELRPSLFGGPPVHEKDDSSPSTDVGEGSVEVEVWDGVREYMPDETNVDDIIATNLVRNYSPHLRPRAIPGSPVEDDPAGIEPSTSDSCASSGTRTHPATITMREVLRGEANEMVKNILVSVLGNNEIWSRDIIEMTSTALGLLYAHGRDITSLLALFALPPSAPSASSHPVSRSSSRPSSRLASSSHTYPSNSYQASVPPSPLYTGHTSNPSQTIQLNHQETVLPFCPQILAPVLSKLKLWGALLEMWKVCRDAEKVVDILVGLTEGTHVDPSVADPLEHIFTILCPPQPDPSTSAIGTGLSISEHERSRLVKKWAAWLTGKDIERGLKLLTSSQPARHRRPTGAAGRGRDRAADREKDAQRADELTILSELRNTSPLAAKRYLEWLIIGRGLGRGGKEATEEGELFEELVWNYVEEVLEYVQDESVGKLWRAKAVSYASSLGSSATASSPLPPPSKSDFLPSPNHPTLSQRLPFLSYFASTTPDSPSKRARIKGLLLLQSLREAKKVVSDIQDKITHGGWDKVLGLEMAILHSKTSSARVTLKTLHNLRDTSTTEAYASSGGLTGVVSTKLGVGAAEGCGLSDWSGWFARNNGMVRPKEEKSIQDGEMLKMLLEVYMEDGNTQQTARFLSSQAKKLDALDILSLVPSTWPLHTLSTYLARSLRRTQHIAHEGQIVRAICAGQNLAVLESTFEVLREEGAIVEEAASDDEESGKGEDGIGRSFDEKVVLHGRHEGEAEVEPVHVGGGEI